MALGHGGLRVGAGRKPKSRILRAVTGHPGHRSEPTIEGQPLVPAAVADCPAPGRLTREAREVWLELAPFALANRTLTPSTSLTFALLCENICREREVAASEDRHGASHRGLIREVNTRLLQFQLAPCGKAIYDAETAAPVVNPLSRFLKHA